MITKRTLYPGQPGAKKWIKKYGQNLLCVRYKYDQNTQKKMITVELVADMQEWHKDLRRIPKNKIVPLKIKFGEVDLGIRVRALGGTWNREKKVWELPFGVVQALGLTDRIVNNDQIFSNIGKEHGREPP